MNTKYAAYAADPNDDPLNKFNQYVREVGIEYPCKLLMSAQSKLYTQINSTMGQIIDAHLILKSCFELYKVMVTPWNERSEHIDQDILQCTIILLLKMCPEDILEKNKKGFSRTIKSNGFFSQATPQLIGFDSQEQVQSNNITNEI